MEREAAAALLAAAQAQLAAGRLAAAEQLYSRLIARRAGAAPGYVPGAGGGGGEGRSGPAVTAALPLCPAQRPPRPRHGPQRPGPHQVPAGGVRRRPGGLRGRHRLPARLRGALLQPGPGALPAGYGPRRAAPRGGPGRGACAAQCLTPAGAGAAGPGDPGQGRAARACPLPARRRPSARSLTAVTSSFGGQGAPPELRNATAWYRGSLQSNPLRFMDLPGPGGGKTSHQQ